MSVKKKKRETYLMDGGYGWWWMWWMWIVTDTDVADSAHCHAPNWFSAVNMDKDSRRTL